MGFKPKMKVTGPKVRVTRPKVSVALAKCGNCGKSFNNPLTHVCVKRASTTMKKRRR